MILTGREFDANNQSQQRFTSNRHYVSFSDPRMNSGKPLQNKTVNTYKSVTSTPLNVIEESVNVGPPNVARIGTKRKKRGRRRRKQAHKRPRPAKRNS